MGFHEDAIFPENISYGSRFGPGFSTKIIVMDSGQEERTARWSTPKHRGDASYGVKTFSDLMDVKKFYIARLGPAYGFKWKDWHDYTSASDGRATSAYTDQKIGDGDDTETDFQLIKTYTDSSISRTRTIIKPKTGSVTIAFDGVEQLSGWTVNYTTGIVTFSVAPTAGVEITAGFEFYVPVRFGRSLDESLEASIDSYDSGSIDAIPVVEIRDASELADEFYYGGAYDHGNVGSNFDITLNQGRVQTFTPTISGLVGSLEAITDIPPGGPHLYLFNEGSYTVTIKDDGGGTVIDIPSGGTGTILVSIDSLSQKSWFGK